MNEESEDLSECEVRWEAEQAAASAKEHAVLVERRWCMDEWEKNVWLDIIKSGLVFSNKQQVREHIVSVLIYFLKKTTESLHTIDQVKNPEEWNINKKRMAKISTILQELKREPDEVTREISLMCCIQETVQDPKEKVFVPPRVKDDVWNAYIGSSISMHRCLCCKKSVISTTDFEVGYAISEANGGVLEIGNLRPICSLCRHAMGASNMVDFVQKYGYFIG